MQRNHVTDQISYGKPERYRSRNGRTIGSNLGPPSHPTLSSYDAYTAEPAISEFNPTPRVRKNFRNALLAAALISTLYSSIACGSGQRIAPTNTTTPTAVVETYTPIQTLTPYATPAPTALAPTPKPPSRWGTCDADEPEYANIGGGFPYVLKKLKKDYTELYSALINSRVCSDGVLNTEEQMFVEALPDMIRYQQEVGSRELGTQTTIEGRDIAKKVIEKGNFEVRYLQTQRGKLTVLVTYPHAEYYDHRNNRVDFLGDMWNRIEKTLRCTEELLGSFPEDTLIVHVEDYRTAKTSVAAVGQGPVPIFLDKELVGAVGHEIRHKYLDYRVDTLPNIPFYLTEGISDSGSLICGEEPHLKSYFVPKGRLSEQDSNEQRTGGEELFAIRLPDILGEHYPMVLREFIARLNALPRDVEWDKWVIDNMAEIAGQYGDKYQIGVIEACKEIILGKSKKGTE